MICSVQQKSCYNYYLTTVLSIYCLAVVEEALCSEIKKLQHYRENGVTTFKGQI